MTAESATHTPTKDTNSKLWEEVGKMEEVNKGLRELMEKRKATHNDQLEQERGKARQLQIRLNKEKDEIIERHLRETEIWTEMKKLYEDAVTTYKEEILSLKKALQEVQNHSQVIKENVRIVLQTHREKFSAQLKTEMDKGWMAWAAHAAELHTYRADWENRKKEGRGFYKLSDETVTIVRKDSANHYQELAELPWP